MFYQTTQKVIKLSASEAFSFRGFLCPLTPWSGSLIIKIYDQEFRIFNKNTCTLSYNVYVILHAVVVEVVQWSAVHSQQYGLFNNSDISLCVFVVDSKCENVVDESVQQAEYRICERCDCQWQRRNTTTIKVSITRLAVLNHILLIVSWQLLFYTSICFDLNGELLGRLTELLKSSRLVPDAVTNSPTSVSVIVTADLNNCNEATTETTSCFGRNHKFLGTESITSGWLWDPWKVYPQNMRIAVGNIFLGDWELDIQLRSNFPKLQITYVKFQLQHEG